MPFSVDHKNLDSIPPIDAESVDPIPTVEVSIARSVSASKGRKQVIVPIKPRVDRLNPDDRTLSRKAKTPQVMDAHYGHRPGNSHDVKIETV
ncbi:hypothetical protein EYZ11_006090 [Aspergillus tanneri]|nr:hypothetical protein EYZ11_006090 [Aspergillus tanneri]